VNPDTGVGLRLFEIEIAENGEGGSKGGVFGNGSESLVVVFPPSLGEPFSAESGFVKAIVFDTEKCTPPRNRTMETTKVVFPSPTIS
jgi:hypothetical protein